MVKIKYEPGKLIISHGDYTSLMGQKHSICFYKDKQSESELYTVENGHSSELIK